MACCHIIISWLTVSARVMTAFVDVFLKIYTKVKKILTSSCLKSIIIFFLYFSLIRLMSNLMYDLILGVNTTRKRHLHERTKKQRTSLGKATNISKEAILFQCSFHLGFCFHVGLIALLFLLLSYTFYLCS